MLYLAAGAPDTTGLPEHGLSDVPEWVDVPVTWLKANEYMTGYPDDTFRPDLPITRGELTRATFRVHGSPPGAPPHPFTDVPAWLDDAVDWVADAELMTGYGDDTFRPSLDITRAQSARVTCRANTPPETC